MEALKACNLKRSFGSQVVLDGFSMSLKKSEFAALMGPSGSGKSTFLHIAAGLIGADGGSVEVGGKDILSLSDSAAAKFRRKHIGFVFQAYNLLASVNVIDNIMLPARLDHTKPDYHRARELMEKLGLDGMEKKFPDELSGGERQRVAIARALYPRPEVVLADEPTGNLDMPSSRGICEIFKELNKTEESAILLVTHDPMVASCAERIHFIKDGKIVASHTGCSDARAVSGHYLETFGK